MTTHLRVYTRREANKYLPGDINPSDFDFNLILTREQKLKLFERNEIMQLMCEWAVKEALRQRITFEEDEEVEYLKFGKVPYTFSATPPTTETVEDETYSLDDEIQAYGKYLEWIGFWIKVQEGMTWSQLFGDAAAFLWNDDEGVEHHKWERATDDDARGPLTLGEGKFYPASEEGTDYSDFDFYYPITDGNGYRVIDTDGMGLPALYEVTLFTEGMIKQKKFYMPAERVVAFPAPRRKIQFGGSSQTTGVELYALAGELLVKDLTRRAALLAGGIATFRGIESQEEANTMDAELGADITSLDRLFLQTGVDFEFTTPDLKLSSEFYSLFDILTRIEARFLRFSQKLMDGESQGVQGSAKFDMLSSYTRIYGLQQHYNQPIEEIFFHLGKTNTSFTWNEIIPEMMDNPVMTTGDETFFGMGGTSDQGTTESEKSEE